MAFTLDKRLEGDSHLVVTHKHIQIRLADDARYFWVILVPVITGDQNRTFVSEIHELPAAVARIYGRFPAISANGYKRIQMRTRSISRHWGMLSANCIFMLWHGIGLIPRGQRQFGGMVRWNPLKLLNVTED